MGSPLFSFPILFLKIKNRTPINLSIVKIKKKGSGVFMNRIQPIYVTPIPEGLKGKGWNSMTLGEKDWNLKIGNGGRILNSLHKGREKLVSRPRLERGTHALKGRCSTN